MGGWRTTKPSGEFAPYYQTYIDEAASGDVVATLEAQQKETAALLKGVSAVKADYRYAPGKWSVKDVIGHLADSERVFTFRALWFARADLAPVPGFDENAWVPAGDFSARALPDLAAEFTAVRAATIAFAGSLGEAAAARRGSANGKEISVRALMWIVAGHERHHIRVLRERYLGA